MDDRVKMQAIGTVEVELPDGTLLEVPWSGPLKRIDVSFSHEFGTHTEEAFEATVELSAEVRLDLPDLSTEFTASDVWLIERLARSAAIAAYLVGDYEEREGV